MSEVSWIEHEGVEAETSLAIGFGIGEDEPLWVPRSVLEDFDEEHAGIQTWWLKKKELSYLTSYTT